MTTRRYQALLRELIETLTDIGNEAALGSEPARRWMSDAFPGHIFLLIECWPENYPPPPDPALIAKLRKGAANESSRAIIERIAQRSSHPPTGGR